MSMYVIATCFRKVLQETYIMSIYETVIRHWRMDESLKRIGKGQITKGLIC